jgi:hypothetical protein
MNTDKKDGRMKVYSVDTFGIKGWGITDDIRQKKRVHLCLSVVT